MPPAASSHALLGAEELSQSRRESTDPLEIGNLTPLQLFEIIPNRHAVRHISPSPHLYPSYNPCEEFESNLAPKHSAAPSARLLLADASMLTGTTSAYMLTETTSVHAIPPTESETSERRNATDIFKVQADTPSLGKIIYFLAVCLFLTVYRRV
jgi:hypothetical protein